MNEPIEKRTGIRTRLLLSALVAALLVAGLAACGDDDESAGPQTGTTYEEVVELDSDRLLGEAVTISAGVEEVLGPNAFLLGEGSAQELLVVSAPDAGNAVVEEGTAVQVTGEVREFRLLDVEGELGVDLDDAAFRDFEEDNYLVAESVGPVSEPDVE